MDQDPAVSPAVSVVSLPPVREWLTALDRFLTAIEDPALGQGEPIDPRKLLTDFRKARDRLLPKLLAARNQTSPEAGEEVEVTVGVEQEPDESSLVEYPTAHLDGIREGYGVLKIIDDADIREEQGEQVDLGQLMTDIRDALFKWDEEATEEEEDADEPGPDDHGMPAPSAAAPFAMSLAAAAGAGARKKPYRCRMAVMGKDRRLTQVCCKTIEAYTINSARTKMDLMGLNHHPVLVGMKGSPAKRKRCKRTGLDGIRC